MAKTLLLNSFFEGHTISSIESFRIYQPSLYTIESLEPCTLKTISQKDFQTIFERSAEIREEIQEHLYKRLVQSQKLFFSFLKNTPQQGYQVLIEKNLK